MRRILEERFHLGRVKGHRDCGWRRDGDRRLGGFRFCGRGSDDGDLSGRGEGENGVKGVEGGGGTLMGLPMISDDDESDAI
jgi:hypothetical protein